MIKNSYKIFPILLLFLSIFYSSLFGKELFTKDEQKWIKDNPKVSIAMLTNFSPFSSVSFDRHEGFTVEITKRIETISGLKFDYKLSHWSEALNSFKTGQVDMIADISFTKKREDFTLYSQEYYEIPTFIFGLKNDANYIDNSSLKGKTVAVSKDLFYIDRLKKLGMNVLEFDSSVDKAKAVIIGKADYFISSYTSGIKVIKNNTFTTLKPIDELQSIKKEDLRFGININKPILQSIIKKSLNQISSSEIKNFSDKWIVYASENKHILNLSNDELEYISKHPVIKYSEVNWKPLSIIEDNRMKGIMGDYLDLVSKRTGLTFKYIPSDSWPHVLEQFKQKKLDLVPGVGSSPQERALGLISNRYAKYPLVIVTSDKFTYVEGLHDLKDKVIAVPKYYTSYNFIVKNFPEIRLITTNSIQEALLLVENGKADAFVGHIATSLYYISELHLKDLKITGTTQFDFEHHYLIQNDKPLLLSIINKTFDSITYQEKKDIYSRWIQTTVVEERTNKRLIYLIIFISSIIILAFIYRQSLLKKYNKKLEDTNKEIESILNSTLEAIFISENGKILSINDSAQKLFKIENKDEVKGKYITDFAASDAKELVRKKLSTSSEPYETNCIRTDGSIFPGLIKGTNIIKNGKQIRISSVIDISEIRNKEKLLIEQSKMAAIGEMIGNIAHQWRQPLSVITTVVSGWSVYNECDNFDKKRVLDESSVILSHAKYLSQTIDDFRLFIKGEKSTKQFDLQSLSDNLFRLLSPSIKANQIMLEKNIISSKKLTGNANELLQALINIINNSIDAIDQNSIKTGVISFLVYDEDSSIVIKISDNAGGIDKEFVDNIYEPYFTTKHQSNGTGLGLYMTYNILNKFNATITAQNIDRVINNKNYTGAEFTIIFPT